MKAKFSKSLWCVLTLVVWACAPKNVPVKVEAPQEAPAVQDSALVLDVPGMPINTLPVAAQKELATVFNDEFCYCGAAHSLGTCLKEHACPLSKRMAMLAFAEASAGVPGVETILNLSAYQKSFVEKRSNFEVDEKLCQGNPRADVTLVEFSDFECPYCAAVAPMLKEVLKQRPSVRVCYRPFPLSMHPHAHVAATVALFAAESGKFWEMHDLLFQNQQTLGKDTFRKLAQTLNLDVKAMEKKWEKGAYDAVIAKAREEGLAAGLRGTPSLYVNGRKFTLGLTVAYLLHTIDDETVWLKNGNQWPESESAPND